MSTATETRAINNMVTSPANDEAANLAAQLESVNTKPLWLQMNRLNPPLPNPRTIPHVWRYEDIRPHLLKAGELVTEKQAERRVLMLVNPARGRNTESLLFQSSSLVYGNMTDQY